MQLTLGMRTHDKSEELQTVDREALVTASGGALPKGIDEAWAAGEAAAQGRRRRRDAR